MVDYEINDRVDITDVVCPMTFVKAKVAMEELEIGQVLAVTMNDGEPQTECTKKLQGGRTADPEAHRQREWYL